MIDQAASTLVHRCVLQLFVTFGHQVVLEDPLLFRSRSTNIVCRSRQRVSLVQEEPTDDGIVSIINRFFIALEKEQ